MDLFKTKYLHEEVRYKAFDLEISKPKVPSYIVENLKFSLFSWQEEAIINFLLYQEVKKKENENGPVHLLFNMATGTGKTLLMASLILYFYNTGKNKFIFFVNQNNIVGKTEDNLVNSYHTKYLFKKNIIINGKNVSIKKVDTFSSYDDDVQILFTTIHSLHNMIYDAKEDSIILEQLQKDDIIMLADEAHHLNSDTKKKKGQTELDIITNLTEKTSKEIVERSWENTVVSKLLNRDYNNIDKFKNNNFLIEFTATIPENSEIEKKYLSKTIYKFDLKDFVKAGFTKEINLISSSFDKRKRVLQALLFNWYRNEIAIKYNIVNFKPVILFRSKYIDKEQENNSYEDYDFFIELIKNLKVDDFDFLDQFDDESLFNVTELYKKGQSRIVDIKRYMLEYNISIQNVVNYLKGAFVERNCIITNSKKGTKNLEKTEDKIERLLNSLEDKSNHVRAIFTVQRLTEGWDVLNLYDIVRMYEGQNSGGKNKGKAGSNTTSEVQLIGRGVRYYPFNYEDKQINKRKFDSELNHELRVLEEFYFHSDNNEKYISELKNELKRQELLPQNDKIIKKYTLKESFIEENLQFYNNLKLYYNLKEFNSERRRNTLKELKEEFDFSYDVDYFQIDEVTLNLDKDDTLRFKKNDKINITLSILFKNFDLHIIKKAINQNAKKDDSILRFDKLSKELNIDSIDDLLKDNFLGLFTIKFITHKDNKFENISNKQKLEALTLFFEKISFQIQSYINPFRGSDFKIKYFKEYGTWYKEKSVSENVENDIIEKELLEKPWYIYNGFNGTSEERNLMKFISNMIGNFESRYEKIFLLRNEELYKIYDFEKGRGFQPDFLLFLKSHNKQEYYQIFIEPKGSQFEDHIGGFSDGKEGWKEEFLEQINDRYGNNKMIKLESKEYRLFGLPLFNQRNITKFEKEVNIMFNLN